VVGSTMSSNDSGTWKVLSTICSFASLQHKKMLTANKTFELLSFNFPFLTKLQRWLMLFQQRRLKKLLVWSFFLRI
jgi:hypothetical protein